MQNGKDLGLDLVLRTLPPFALQVRHHGPHHRDRVSDLRQLVQQRMVQLFQHHRDRCAPQVQIPRGRGTTHDQDALHPLDVADTGKHLVGHGFGLGQCRAGRKFNADRDAADILGWHEAARNLQHEEDRDAKCDKGAEQRQVAEPRGDRDKAQVVAHGPAVLLIAMALGILRTHKVGGHHRRDQTRDQQREGNRNRHGHAELPEVLPRNTRHEADRHKDGDDGEGRGNHRKTDFVRGLDGRAVGGLAHSDMPGDVLDLDDGVIDQNAGGQRDGEERHKVQREAQQIHDVERGDRRKRQRDCRNQGRAPVLQECQHDKHGKDRAFDQGMQSAFVVAVGVEHRVVDQLDLDIRIGRADLVQRRLHRFGHRDLGGPLGAENGKGHGGFAVEAHKAAQFFICVVDRAKVAQTNVPTVAGRDHGLRQRFHRAGIAQRADRLFVHAQLCPARADIGIRRAKLCAYRLRGDAPGTKLHLIQLDTDLAVGTAVAVNAANTRAPLQCTGDRVIDKPRQLFHRHVGGRDRKGHDRLALDVDTADDRLVDICRQIAADLVDRVLHILNRLVGRHIHVELDKGLALAVGDLGRHLLDAGNTGHRILDLFCDLGFQFGRRRAALRHDNGDQRDINVRKARDGQAVEALPAQEHEHEERQKRRDRISDRPGRKVHLFDLIAWSGPGSPCRRRAQRHRPLSRYGRRRRALRQSQPTGRRGCRS